MAQTFGNESWATIQRFRGDTTKHKLILDGLRSLNEAATQETRLPSQRNFSSAELPQTQSTFMRQLDGTPELRLMIFAYLVCNDGIPLQRNSPTHVVIPEDPQESIAKGQPYKVKIGTESKSFSFTPSVLGVCQCWYREAVDILYLKNTIAVDVYSTGDAGFFLWIMGNQYITDSSNTGYGLMPNLPRGIAKYGKRLRISFRSRGLHQNPSSLSTIELYMLVPGLCATLVYLAIGRSISIHFLDHSSWSHKAKARIMAITATAMRLLRCEKLSIFGPPSSGCSAIPSILHSLVEEVTGKS